MKRKLNRLMAFLLTITMTVSVLPGGAVTARAAGSVASSSGKPQLFVDFLGHSIPATPGQTATPVDPATEDQSAITNPGVGTWTKYGPAGSTAADETPTTPGTVFWVGVGIDKMAAFQLAKDGMGLYGAELGFYYNNEFVEPYTGTGGQTFADVIGTYNLGSRANQWDSSLYRVAAAESGLEPASDAATQEYRAPTGSSWKMVYASIQKQEGKEQTAAGGNPNRFSRTTSTDTQYILMIPFVLKKHDPNLALCFRLVRNAGIFSIGGGQKGYTIRDMEADTSDYGAWEKITRNRFHNLKQMFDFTGDLNIFTGLKVPDPTYSAQLVLLDAAGTGNKAELRVKDDPFAQPVNETTIAAGTDTLTGLYEGTVMELTVQCASDTTAKVTVTNPAEGSVTVTTVTEDQYYTFVMPGFDVMVTVDYDQKENPGDYVATLKVEDPDSVPGNSAKLKQGENESTDKLTVSRGSTVTVLVDCDSEYDVEVAVKNVNGNTYTVTTVTDRQEYTFVMPSSDVDVIVTYTKAELHDAMLAVDKPAGGLADNAAKLSYVDGSGATVATEELNQATGNATSSIQARDGRSMTVDIKTAPGYTAVVVLTYVGSGRSETLNVDPITGAAPGDYTHRATFSMPKEDVIVKVDYVQASVFKATLDLVDTAGEADNTATLTATDSLGTHTATGHGNSISVIEGTEVTIDLSTADNYHVADVQIIRQDADQDTVPFRGTYASGTLTFDMPTGVDVKVQITYAPGELETSILTLVLDPEAPNSGAWDDNGIPRLPDLKAEVGKTATANIKVEPGWYIDSVTARSATTGYTVTVSGNGYNNGAGGNETVTLTVPPEDTTVTVTFKEGPPPVDKRTSVTLIVNDAENDDGADNWAQLAIGGGTPRPDGGQKKDDPNTVIWDPEVNPGDKVRVKIHTADGYKLEKGAEVVIGPSTLGIIPKWIDAETLEFTQPAGHTTVTVNFKKGELTPDDAYTATLHKTLDTDGTAALTNTRSPEAPLAPADMTTGVDGGTVKAFAGDKLTIDAAGTGGMYVVAVYAVDKNGAALTLTPPLLLNNNGGPQAAEFTMPAGDIDVYVVYGSVAPPEDSHAATLKVIGPEGGAVGEAGQATISRDPIVGEAAGSESATAQSNGPLAQINAITGSTVKVSITPQPGYGIEAVILTPDGVETLRWPGGNNVEFTMPGENVGVIVRLVEGEGTKYTADIVVRPPAGVTPAEAGDAVFTANGLYSIVALPGTDLPISIQVQPGYFLDRVEITPRSLGVNATVGGAYAAVGAGFVMPAGDVTANVYIKKGWPGESDLTATLKVEGPEGISGNTATLTNTSAERGADTGALTAGQQSGVTARDGDPMTVTATAADGYTWTVELKDAANKTVTYKWSGVGQVSFDMPALNMTATVTFAEGETQKHTAALTDPSKPNGELANLTTPETGDSVTALRGETVRVTATPPPLQRLAGVLVTGASGTAIPLSTPITGNTADFVMPDEDVTVYLVFGSEHPEVDGYTATLWLSGPAGAGTGVLTDVGAGNSVTVGACPGSGSANIAAGNGVTAVPTAADGYAVDRVEVTAADGRTLTYGWDWRTVSLDMPDTDVTILVVFREATQEDEDGYTAQLVVDDGGEAGNTAALYKDGETAADGRTLVKAKAGEKVMVDLTVAPGSAVQLISVTPTKYGVTVQPLTAPVTQSQTTSFIMPAGDVTVFVRFSGDTMIRYNVTMAVTHGPQTAPDTADTATLDTPYSGTLGPINYQDPAVVGLAGKGEKVTVTASPISGYYVTVEVTDDDGNGSPVQVTKDKGTDTFWFTMTDSPVKVNVIFHDREKEPPTTRRAYLHLTNALAGDAASITLHDDTSVTTSVDGGFIEGPQGDLVDLKATAGADRFIKEAYVMWGNGVLYTVLPGDGADNTEQFADFALQAGDLHVYVVFDSNDNLPDPREYSAVLTVTGPTGEAPGAAGRATLSRQVDGAAETTEEVLSNDTATFVPVGETDPVTIPKTGVLTVKENETVTVTVTVEAGYELDLVVLTPLDLPLTATPVAGTPGQYTFTMPAANVGVEVRLKSGSRDNIYKATLHLEDPSAAGDTPGVNAGSITFGHQVADADGESISVPAAESVSVTVTPADGYYVKRAYVLQDNNMVPLNEALSRFQGTDPATSKSTVFTMPEGAVDVYIVFAQGTAPDTPEYTAVLTVTDPAPNSGSSSVTLDNGRTAENAPSDGLTSVTAPSDGLHYRLTALDGDTMTMTMVLQDGYSVKSITVAPGTVFDPPLTITPVQDPLDKNRYTFTMPASDVSVWVELDTGALDTYTATLVTVDQSTGIGNRVTMTDGLGGSVVNNGSLTGLEGTEDLRLNMSLRPNVKVAKVLYTTPEGTKTLTTSAGAYVYAMKAEDVTITVYLTDDPEKGPPTHFVTVEKVGWDDQNGNSAAIRNTSETGMVGGPIWTAVHEGNNAELTVGTADGYYIYSVTAARDSNGSPVTVRRTGAGTYVLTAPPDDVTITVTYSTSAPDPVPGDIELSIGGVHGGSAANTAALGIAPDMTAPVSVSGADTAPKTLAAVPSGSLLRLTTGVDAGYHVERAVLTVGGRNITLGLRAGAAEFYMPELAAGETARVTVYFAEGTSTARPYDPANTDNSANGYRKGWLAANNLGGGRLRITVPTLTADEGTTLQNADQAGFTLYLWDGLEYQKLVRGTDYELMTDPYAVGAYYTGYQGARFTIRSLIGGSSLSEVVARGGLLYISATEAGKAESELVEVEVPADTGRYKATLRIVDMSGIPGSGAVMSDDGFRSVDRSGQSITGLLGDETIRTEVTLAPGARLVSVTATETSGTNLLTEAPDGTGRYAWDMTGRDVIITVRIERDPPPDDPNGPLYLASVVKVNDHQLVGNDAAAFNATIPTMSKGEIWAYGYESNVVRVAVTTEPGYYAAVTAVNKTTGAAVPVWQTGAAPAVGTGSFDAFVTMPASDVQVTVTYSKDPPADQKNRLTLAMTGAAGSGYDAQADNNANLTWTGDGGPLELTVRGGSPTKLSDTYSADGGVLAGTALHLQVNAYTGGPTPQDNYYVAKVELRATRNGMTTTATLKPDSTGAVDFVMPYGRATVTVTYAKGEQMPQPYDETHTGSTLYEDGWIGAVSAGADTLGHRQINVTVPALWNWVDGSLDHAYADNGAGGSSVDFKFYYKDAYGAFVELKQGTGGDILVSNISSVAGTHLGAAFTVTSLKQGGMLDDVFTEGGILYITAVDGTGAKGESRYTELVIPASHTATLYYTDNSGVAGNRISLGTAGRTPVTGNGDRLTGLIGTEELNTVVTTQTGASVYSVMVSDNMGSRFVNAGSPSNQYDYTMDGKDVDVRVLLGKTDDPDPIWRAAAAKVDADLLADNTVTIANTTDGAMTHGDIWTDARQGHLVELTVSTAMGYYAVIQAKRTDTGAAVPVMQTEVTGDFTAPLIMPDANVEITVTFSTEAPKGGNLTLKIAEGSGTATVSGFGTTLMATTADPTAGPASFAVGTDMELNAVADTGFYLKDAKLVVILGAGTANELATTLTLAGGMANFKMPLSDAEVRVYFAEGTQSPRPYDPAHTGSTEGYRDGWIEAQNQGGNALVIGVPTLTADDGATLENADDAAYRLYIKDALGNYQPLDVDITVTGGAPKGLFTGYTGWEFTAASNKTNTALDKILTDGGVLYITAKRDGEGESEYTEVVVPAADQKTYTATLKIVDLATDQTSTYRLEDDRGRYVTLDGEQITGLLGGENITASVTALAPGAKVQGVTITTDSTGTVYLTDSGGNVYGAVMPKEDAVFTIFLEDENLPPEKKIYIATVETVDDTGLEGNTADIDNGTTHLLPKGAIWSAGRMGDDMVVSFTTADGIYAYITAVNKETGEQIEVLQLGVTGSGKGYFDMPAANVQVTVTFTDEPPDPVDLTLALTGHEESPGNKADVYTKADGSTPVAPTATPILSLAGSTGAGDPLSITAADKVTPGTYLEVRAGHDDSHTVKAITIRMTTLGGYTLDLPVTNDVTTVQMPLNAATITVIFQPGRETARPYDPLHKVAADGAGEHQDGWLEGENLGGGSATVTVPTLLDHKEAADGSVTDTLLNADKHSFELYWYSDILDTYVKLVKDTDYTVVPGSTVTGNYYTDPGADGVLGTDDDVAYQGTQFTVSEVAGGRLDGLLDDGLTLYITATQTDPAADTDGVPWTESQRTELVIPPSAKGLRPYDPLRVNEPDAVDPRYEDHWIRADNRGDSAVITVPTLADEEDKLFDVTEEHSFKLYLLEEDGSYTDLSQVTVQLHPDTGDTAAPYKLGNYYTAPATADDPERPYTGARFTVRVLTDEELGGDTALTALAARMRKILDNDGTAAERLYIQSVRTVGEGEDAVLEESALVDLEVAPYYTLKGELEAYAPKHEATFGFYAPKDPSGDLTDPANYGGGEAAMEFKLRHDQGKRLWTLPFELKSSELSGTWLVVVSKPGHVEYRQVNFTLDTAGAAPGHVFELDGTVMLFGGDVDGDGSVKVLDREILMAYAGGSLDYTWAETEDEEGWESSIYNPETLAYAADLDGDGMISMMDLSVIMHERNYNMARTDYPAQQLTLAGGGGP